MKYLNEKIQVYLEDLRAKKSTPGGGAAAALTGAQGAALVMMVAEFTIGNEKYAEFEEACKGARAANSYVYANLAMLVDQDAEAYSKVVEARKMPDGTDAEKAVKKVAVIGGAGADDIENALKAGADTLVTGDVKYHQFLDAKNIGINLIDAGHFATENPVVQALRDKLSEKLPEVRFEVSSVHTDSILTV